MCGVQNFETPLKNADYEVVEKNINKISVIEAKTPEKEDPEVERLRERIFSDYDGTVFRDKVYPNPPERGPFGYAYIKLKEGAVPQRQKPFFMHGERQEAYKRVVQDWIENDFIERPTKWQGEWLSQGFVVPKPKADFPWRGWQICVDQIAKRSIVTTPFLV